jgi:UDP-3-O-[3-hydroxymyristoyl] glucosamine N-acyltransferase
MTFTLGQIASEIGAELRGDPGIEIKGPATLETAQPGDITYIASRKFSRHLKSTGASAVIVYPGLESKDRSILVAKDPYLAFALVMRMFYRVFPEFKPGIERTAIIPDDVRIADSCHIGHYVVISQGARIGEKTAICSGAFIGENVIISDNCVIFQNVTIRENVRIGNNVVIYPNAVIGSDGFGYSWNGEVHLKIPQAGTVVIEDNVEIGAGTTIDRATLGETVVGRGTIIDNLVQIAHNCRIGPGSVLCAQVGLAGTTELGRRVTLAGQVGLAGHLKIGDNAIVEAQSGVPSDIDAGSVVFGTPAREVYLAHKIEAILNRLPDYVKRIKKLETYFRQNE